MIVGVIEYSDHDCDRFGGVQIKEDISVTNMNVADIDKIGLSVRNITGESSYLHDSESVILISQCPLSNDLKTQINSDIIVMSKYSAYFSSFNF